MQSKVATSKDGVSALREREKKQPFGGKQSINQ